MGFLIFMAVILIAAIVLAVIVTKSTPDKREANENHRQMARELDRVLADADIRPLLPATNRDNIARLVDAYYEDNTHTTRLKELSQ